MHPLSPFIRFAPHISIPELELGKRCLTPFVWLAAEDKDGKTIVTSRVTGNFPGSPVELRYLFGLEGNKIASLEILP